jgi:hypothetical protein
LAGRGGVGRWITVWVGGRRPLAARRQQAPSPRVVVRPRTATASTAGRRARPGLLGSVPVTKSLANNFLVVKAVRVETYESNVRKRQRVGVGVLRSCVSGGRRHRLWAVRVVVIGWPGLGGDNAGSESDGRPGPVLTAPEIKNVSWMGMMRQPGYPTKKIASSTFSWHNLVFPSSQLTSALMMTGLILARK